jgi:predicted acetyltransferase
VLSIPYILAAIMSSSFNYRPLANDSEVERLKTLDAQCFLGTEKDADIYFSQVGVEAFRSIWHNDDMMGGLSILPMGQWWGGQRVPMAGIASVGIAPEHRGKGGAIALMRSAVQEIYDRNIPLSVLYPATQRLYRKAGYEQGGIRCAWEMRTDQIHLRERSLPLMPIAPDPEILNPIYAQHAARYSGLCDRHQSIWLQRIQPKADETVYAYRVGTDDHPQGYMVFTQSRDSGQGTLAIRDWAALTVEAAKTLWGFLFSHRSQITRIQWTGGAVDPMLPLLPEQSAQMIDREMWMLRIVNVPLALESRGYPPTANANLHLKIHDDGIDANTGAFTLSVSNGKGTVQPGGQGDLEMSIRGLAALYAGFHSPHHLRWMGWLSGSDDSVAIAHQLFAGSSPWMSDFF